MTLPRSNQEWIAGIAGDGLVTIGDPRLKEPAALVQDARDVLALLDSMAGRLRGLNGAAWPPRRLGRP